MKMELIGSLGSSDVFIGNIGGSEEPFIDLVQVFSVKKAITIQNSAVRSMFYGICPFDRVC